MTDQELANRAGDARKPIVFTGRRLPLGRVEVRKNGTLCKDSHTFGWGRNGGGPSALAWWLLSESAGPEAAHRWAWKFVDAVVRQWLHAGWETQDGLIRAWIAQQEADDIRRAEDAHQDALAEEWANNPEAARDEAAAICAEF